MDDAVDLFELHEGIYGFEVADVHLDEFVVGFAFEVLEVGEVACVGKLVEADDAVVGIFFDE